MGRKDGNFVTDSGVTIIWDTIVQAFAASQDLEWEVLSVPDGVMIDGQKCVETPLDVGSLQKAVQRAIKRNELYGTIRVRYTRKQGGHVWLQKIEAEIYPEELESVKILNKSNRRKVRND